MLMDLTFGYAAHLECRQLSPFREKKISTHFFHVLNFRVRTHISRKATYWTIFQNMEEMSSEIYHSTRLGLLIANMYNLLCHIIILTEKNRKNRQKL